MRVIYILLFLKVSRAWDITGVTGPSFGSPTQDLCLAPFTSSLGKAFLVFSIQAETHLGHPGWEVFYQGTPGFGTHWEHPWPNSAAQKQSGDGVTAGPVQSCEEPDGLISLCVLLYSSKQSVAAVSLSWRGLAASVGGNAAVALINHQPSINHQSIINHPCSRGRVLIMEWTTPMCQKTTWPSSCWAVSPANAREKQSLRPLLPIKVRTTFRLDGRLGYYSQCSWTGGFTRDDWLPNSAPMGRKLPWALLKQRMVSWSAKCCGNGCVNPGKFLALQRYLL